MQRTSFKLEPDIYEATSPLIIVMCLQHLNQHIPITQHKSYGMIGTGNNKEPPRNCKTEKCTPRSILISDLFNFNFNSSTFQWP